MKTDIYIVIPARYASSRLPGKPLIKIAGTEMIKRVADIADYVCRQNLGCQYVIATDDQRIEDFCKTHALKVVMTDPECKNGTERCWDAIQRLGETPKLIINLQGDNPLCPPWIIQSIIDEWQSYGADVYTPCVHLDWAEYDQLKKSKEITPYSGTTVLVDKDKYALAFSKTIIPTIRKEEEAKKNMDKSPVRRHIGLYAYTYQTLKDYFTSEESDYEQNFIEGLEQMRFLYNGLKIKIVEVDYQGRETTAGVDSPEDLERVEAILKTYGEFNLK